MLDCRQPVESSSGSSSSPLLHDHVTVTGRLAPVTSRIPEPATSFLSVHAVVTVLQLAICLQQVEIFNGICQVCGITRYTPPGHSLARRTKEVSQDIKYGGVMVAGGKISEGLSVSLRFSCLVSPRYKRPGTRPSGTSTPQLNCRGVLLIARNCSRSRCANHARGFSVNAANEHC